MNKKVLGEKRSYLLLFFFSLFIFSLAFASAWNFESTGVNVNNNITVNGTHNSLVGLQGGSVAEYFHLNQTVYNAVAANYSLWITAAGADTFIPNFTNFSRIYANVTLYNISWSNTTNLTYFIGYNYAINSTGGSDSFIANYSNFSTLYGNQYSNYTNFTTAWGYIFNATGTDSFIANFTNFTRMYANITDYNTSWSSTTNTSYLLGTNTTYAYSLNDTLWTANYSTYLLKPTWAQVTNTTLVALNGSTNTWNANQTYVNNYITNGTGGAYIYHNGTGWVIKG